MSAGTKLHTRHCQNAYLIHAWPYGRLWRERRGFRGSPRFQQRSLLLRNALCLCQGSSLGSLLRLALGKLARRSSLQLLLASGTLLVGAQRCLILRVLLGPKLTVEGLLQLANVSWRAAQRVSVSQTR